MAGPNANEQTAADFQAHGQADEAHTLEISNSPTNEEDKDNSYHSTDSILTTPTSKINAASVMKIMHDGNGKEQDKLLGGDALQGKALS
jgi:hypothetical protein